MYRNLSSYGRLILYSPTSKAQSESTPSLSAAAHMHSEGSMPWLFESMDHANDGMKDPEVVRRCLHDQVTKAHAIEHANAIPWADPAHRSLNQKEEPHSSDRRKLLDPVVPSTIRFATVYQLNATLSADIQSLITDKIMPSAFSILNRFIDIRRPIPANKNLTLPRVYVPKPIESRAIITTYTHNININLYARDKSIATSSIIYTQSTTHPAPLILLS